jgi:indolepyruvate ferredoxin oxidoreductase beta subunit
LPSAGYLKGEVVMSNYEPLNLIVCGTGGQGNVLLSRFLARAFTKKGYNATIGETFGMSQRGGAVMSHVRVSKQRSYGPLIPEGKGTVVLSLEPMETIRVLGSYGNPDITVISNTRPVYPMEAITGEKDYPSIDDIKHVIQDMSACCWFLDATQISLDLGNRMLTNMIMTGALIQANVVDLTRVDIEGIIRETFRNDIAQANINAANRGMEAVQKS